MDVEITSKAPNIYQLDMSDTAYIEAAMTAYHARPTLTQGDYIQRLDGSVFRIAHIWEQSNGYCEVQPAIGENSVYINKNGWGSFSGSLEQIEKIHFDVKHSFHRGHAWTWTRRSGAGMGTTFTAQFRLYKQVAALEWSELWNAMKASPDQWIRTTKEMYDEQLCCMPPTRHRAYCFLVGEPERHNDNDEPVFAAFKFTTEGYFAKYQTILEFNQGR